VKYSIKKVDFSDLHEISEIERYSFTTAWSLNAFVEELKNPRSIGFVAIVDKLILGYIFGQIIIDEAHILDLAVRPGYRRKGIATALVKYILEVFSSYGCKDVFLEVRRSNIAAIKLYEKLGFCQVGIRKDYYQFPQEDALIMKKDIM
jgi:ribosomal-protein-alanine N-acetyltransferase